MNHEYSISSMATTRMETTHRPTDWMATTMVVNYHTEKKMSRVHFFCLCHGHLYMHTQWHAACVDPVTWLLYTDSQFLFVRVWYSVAWDRAVWSVTLPWQSCRLCAYSGSIFCTCTHSESPHNALYSASKILVCTVNKLLECIQVNTPLQLLSVPQSWATVQISTPDDSAVVGREFVMTCTVTAVRGLMAVPSVVWTGPDGNLTDEENIMHRPLALWPAGHWHCTTYSHQKEGSTPVMQSSVCQDLRTPHKDLHSIAVISM